MTCNKMTFIDKKTALTEVAIIKSSKGSQSGKYGNKKIKAYLCDRCDRWHLTSRDKRKGKQLKTHNKKLKKK